MEYSEVFHRCCDGLRSFRFGVTVDFSICGKLQRRPLFQELIGKGTLPEGNATPSSVALQFVNEKLYKAISQEAGKGAYHVYLSQSGKVIEDRIEPERLTTA